MSINTRRENASHRLGNQLQNGRTVWINGTRTTRALTPEEKQRIEKEKSNIDKKLK